MWCCCCWCRRRRRRRPIHHRPRSTASHIIIIIIISHLFVCMYVWNKQSNSSSQEFCKADPFLFFAYFFGSWVIVFLETGSSFSEGEEEEEEKGKLQVTSLFLFCFFWFTFQQQIKNKIVSFMISWRLSFPNLHTKTPKIPHKTKKSPLQAQNQFAASKAKQSKATRRTTRRKLWTWPKSHTHTHTHTHPHQKHNTKMLLLLCLEERIQAWSWIIWASFLHILENKSNPSCKNPNSL